MGSAKGVEVSKATASGSANESSTGERNSGKSGASFPVFMYDV